MLPREGDDRKTLILHRGKHAFIIMNKFPYNNGHLMVVPNLHAAEYADLNSEVLAEMNDLTQLAIAGLKDKYAPQGLNLGMNIGAASGAGVKDHLHLHIVPRWVGDTNFMPIIAETKCMPQHLEKSYDLLYEYFQTSKS